MSKLFLRILLCAGFGLSAFPISSMEKGEQGDASGRKKPLTSSSQEEPASSSIPQPSSSAAKKEPKFVADLERTQEAVQEVQKKIEDYPKELLADTLELILNAPHTDDEPFSGRPGHKSTDPIEYETNKKVTAKVTEEVLKSIKKAVHPAYAALFLTDTDKAVKVKTFKSLPDSKVVSVHPQIVAKRIDIAQLGFKSGGTATAMQKEHDDKEAQSDLTKYKLMVRKLIGDKVIDIPLCYPMKEEGVIGNLSQQMVDAILTLNFTFLKDKVARLEKVEEVASLQSLVLSLPPVSKMQLASVNEEETEKKERKKAVPDSSEKKEKKKERKSVSKIASPKKGEPRSGSKKERGKGTQLATSSATPLPSTVAPRIRSASAPKPSFLKGLEGIQAKVQQLLESLPENLNKDEISLIVNSSGKVQLGKNLWARATNDVSLLPKAICQAYVLHFRPWELLRPEDVAVVYPNLVAIAEEYDLQFNHQSPTVTGKLAEGTAAGASIKKYVIKKALDGEPIKYPGKEGNMITAYLELNIMAMEEEKTEEKA